MRAALVLLGGSASAIIRTPPLGPSLRRYANAVAVIESDEAPDVLLRRLKVLERRLGRRRGQRWGARVIDLDIVLWGGGAWRSKGLVVPHAGFRARRFVLDPLAELAPGWRDPVSGLSVRQLRARLTARRPVPSRANGVGP